MSWCPHCRQDVRWADKGLVRYGTCGCAETWVLKVIIGDGYKRLTRKRQFMPASFEIKETKRPGPLGEVGRV